MADHAIQDVDKEKKKRSLGKILLLGVNGLLFLMGAGFFIVTKMGFLEQPMIQPAKQTEQRVANVDERDVRSPANTKLVDLNLPPLVVNLSGDDGQRYLRIVLQVQVQDERARKVVNDQLVPIQNALIFLLSSKTFRDIRTVEGKYRLQEEIRQNLNDTLGQSLVTKAYFREFIVQ